MAAGALVLYGDGDDGEGEAEERVALSTRSISECSARTGPVHRGGLARHLADAAAAAGVAATGAIILATGGWYWLDPAVALAIAAVVAYHALALIRKFPVGFGPQTADSNG